MVERRAASFVAASSRDRPRPLRLRRDDLADPPGMARGHGADVRRGAPTPGGRVRRRRRADGPRRHHEAQRQADDLPDDPARRPDRGAGGNAAASRSNTSTNISDGSTATSAPGPPASSGARSRPKPGSSTASARCSNISGGSACGSTSPAGPTNSAVRREAGLLDVSRYFGPNIHGAQDDYKSFSKKMVIDRILAEHGITGRSLLAFGDGYVEIENTKQVGRAGGGRGQRRGEQRLGAGSTSGSAGGSSASGPTS